MAKRQSTDTLCASVSAVGRSGCKLIRFVAEALRETLQIHTKRLSTIAWKPWY
jgi:hypothetical protein